MHGSTTPKIRFSEPRLSEILDLMNKLQLPFHILLFIQTRFSELTQLIVNKRGLTTMFTKSSLGYTIELLNSDTIF